MSGHWSDGVVFGLPFFGGIAVICLVIAVLAWRHYARLSEYKRRYCDSFPLAIVSSVMAVLIIAVMVIAYFPYGRVYHRWEYKSIVVAEVRDTKPFEPDGTYVITGDDGDLYMVEYDTRIAAYHTGDAILLSCKLQYERTARDWWSCALG